MELPRSARRAVLFTLTAAACAGVAAPAAPGASSESHGRRGCARTSSTQESSGSAHRRCAHHRRPIHLAPCAGATLIPNSHDVTQVRAATVCLVNHARIVHGIAPLRVNRRMQRAAQMHTESMAFGDYFQHVGPSGQTPAARMKRVGYIASRRVSYSVGENIGLGTLSLATPRAIVRAWMHSPGHRANILDAHYRDTAVGVSAHPPTAIARGQHGAVYTEDFGVIVNRRHRR